MYDVLYVTNIMYNLNAESQVRRNNCCIVVDNAGVDSWRGILMIEDKDSHQAKILAHEQMRGSIEPSQQLRHNEEAHVARLAVIYNWHKLLGHCSDEILKTSSEHVREINEKDVKGHEKIHCDTVP